MQTIGGVAIGGSLALLAPAAHTRTQSMARSIMRADGGGGAWHPEACAVLPRIAISMIALCRVGHATYTAATTIAIIDIAIVMRRDHRRSSRFEPVGVRLRSMRHKQPHTLIQSMRVWKIMSMQTSSNMIS